MKITSWMKLSGLGYCAVCGFASFNNVSLPRSVHVYCGGVAESPMTLRVRMFWVMTFNWCHSFCTKAGSVFKVIRWIVQVEPLATGRSAGGWTADVRRPALLRPSPTGTRLECRTWSALGVWVRVPRATLSKRRPSEFVGEQQEQRACQQEKLMRQFS